LSGDALRRVQLELTAFCGRLWVEVLSAFERRRVKNSRAGAAAIGGLKSEVQHLAPGKVPRCKPELRTDSFSRKNA
jgi:hypothetical protein